MANFRNQLNRPGFLAAALGRAEVVTRDPDRRPILKDGTRRDCRIRIDGMPNRWAAGMPAPSVGPLRPRLTSAKLARVRLAVAQLEAKP